jgi:hypothetical protein
MNIHMNLQKISNITVLKIESWPGQQGHLLHKNLGNGSFADSLAAISVNFVDSGARQNWGPIRGQSDLIRPNQFWQYSRSKTRFWRCADHLQCPKKVRRARPDQPDNGKDEYYYVSYSY